MRLDRNGENEQKCRHQSGHYCEREQKCEHQYDHDNSKDMLNRWIPAVFSESVLCVSVSLFLEGRFGSNNEFSGISGNSGNPCRFLGEDIGSISGGSFLGGSSKSLCGRNSDVFFEGYFRDFCDDNVPLSHVEPTGFVFSL